VVITSVFGAIWPNEFSSSVQLIIFPSTIIYQSIKLMKLAISILISIFPITIVYRAIFPVFPALSVLKVVLPLTDVHVMFQRVSFFTMSMLHAILPFTIINNAIRTQLFTSSLLYFSPIYLSSFSDIKYAIYQFHLNYSWFGYIKIIRRYILGVVWYFWILLALELLTLILLILKLTLLITILK
jgi:hypothetical protein